jgi:hypothetical protein
MIFVTNGTGAGAAAFLTDYTNGYANGFVQTDGGDSIDFGDIDAAEGCTQLTVSAWIWTMPTAGSRDGLICKWPVAASGGSWALLNGFNEPVQSNLLFVVEVTNKQSWAEGVGFLQPSNWIHVVAVYDSWGTNLSTNAMCKLRLYRNGTQYTNHSGASQTSMQTPNANAITNSANAMKLFLGGAGGAAVSGTRLDEPRIFRNLAFDQLMSTNLFNETKQKFGYAP